MSNDFSPTHLYTDTGSYTVTLVAVDSATCNIIDSTSQILVVHSKPQAAFSDQPIPPAANTPTIFTNNSSGATRFKWLFGDGDGDTITRTTRSNPDTVIHQYQSTGTFQACLVPLTRPVVQIPPVCLSKPSSTPCWTSPTCLTSGRFGINSIVRSVV
jgi:hypothetical protein